MLTRFQVQIDEFALDVLKFMARHVQSRPLLHELLTSDIDHWNEIAITDKPKVFERDVRRFAAACPTLAQKDRIKHASEGLHRMALKAS
jgi:hypothetical protein